MPLRVTPRFFSGLVFSLLIGSISCTETIRTDTLKSSVPSPTASVVSAQVMDALPLEKVVPPAGIFFTLPYLQLGDNPTDPGTLAVAWHIPGNSNAVKGWELETRSPAGSKDWIKQKSPVISYPVAVGGIAPHTVCVANLAGLVPGKAFDYRIVKNGKPVFSARANRARASADQPSRMVIFGDCAEDTAWQRKVAYQTFRIKPDWTLITGDIVYPHGRASEYRQHFFPIYNAEVADPKRGAPLLRSTLFVGDSGNHDLDYANLNRYPDGLAYYYYWQHPHNGFGTVNGKSDHPPLSGPDAAFRKAAGPNYPNGANFSFDYGNAHWVVIDSNYYMNWDDPGMIAKLKAAITARPDATWRFVVFHVAPFHSSATHQEEQWMRTLAPVLEECGVDVVFSGHVHNYQRTYPLRFKPTSRRQNSGKVSGEWTLDTTYDGEANTKSDGILYLVTGAGGAALYPKTYNADDPSGTLEPYTAKYIADIHSLTIADIEGGKLSIRQIDENGKELDRFTITK